MIALIGSLFFAGVGALVLGNTLYWRRHARRVSGVVAGVRPGGGGNDRRRYRKVLRYTDIFGRVVETTSPFANRDFAAMHTGRQVRLLVLDEQPERVREEDVFFLEFFAITFLIGGFLIFPPTSGDLTLVLVIALAVAAFVLGFQWSARRRAPVSAFDSALQLRAEAMTESPIVDVAGVPDAVQVARGSGRIGGAIASGFALVLGLSMGWAGLSDVGSAVDLANNGVEVAGIVVSLNEEGDSGDSATFPVVQFTGANGAVIQFEDQRTFFSSLYHVGDKVRVFYQKSDPSGSAGLGSPFRALVRCVMVVIFGGTMVASGIFSLRGLVNRES